MFSIGVNRRGIFFFSCSCCVDRFVFHMVEILCLFDRGRKEWSELSQRYLKALVALSSSQRSAGDEVVDPHVQEVLMDLCFTLLSLGDSLGLIVVDVEGFVNWYHSDRMFLEGMIMCMEITHLICLRLLEMSEDSPRRCEVKRDTRVYTIVSAYADYQQVFSTLGRTCDVRLSHMSIPDGQKIPRIQLLRCFLDVSSGMFERGHTWFLADPVRCYGPSTLGVNVVGARMLRRRDVAVGDEATLTAMDYLEVVLLLRSGTISALVQQRRLLEQQDLYELHCEVGLY